MKKTYLLKVKNKTVERQVDAIKFEVKKYITRERKKELAEGDDYWDFDCRIGQNEEVAESFHLSKVNEMISNISSTDIESFYLEILAKPAKRIKKESD